MSGEQYDAPNQQVVRGDGSGPADEGTGGSQAPVEPNPLDSMTKDELLEYAEAHEVEASAAMTKADIRAAIDEHEAAGE